MSTTRHVRKSGDELKWETLRGCWGACTRQCVCKRTCDAANYKSRLFIKPMREAVIMHNEVMSATLSIDLADTPRAALDCCIIEDKRVYCKLLPQFVNARIGSCLVRALRRWSMWSARERVAASVSRQ